MGNIEGKIKNIKCIYPKEENREAFNELVAKVIIDVALKKLPQEYLEMLILKLKEM
ncbi:hypothetical protein SAMN02745163_02862 [Clostridium cavendishii DSM 21758]|uniref:Uncharacterized protein n=1 Tax=Clostridium cavendishii DSM 21758 TaxID=1121302 RepID=A0A1M6NC66_9CLOT|nr:hypothetical protein [Clostridium cavendishii]SHJ93330.1 hypothetical protein SAMN02745163_02862 [Clostridium cavendishii DSM 21758]